MVVVLVASSSYSIPSKYTSNHGNNIKSINVYIVTLIHKLRDENKGQPWGVSNHWNEIRTGLERDGMIRNIEIMG